jgi:hypothetical protein
MTVKLVKRNQQADVAEKPSQKPSRNELLTTTQAWVEEFKARKAQNNASMMSMLRRA